FANRFCKLIEKKAKLLRKFGKPIMVPIDGQYRAVDPSQWPDEMIARARVGLGSTRKDQRMAMRREVLQMQMAAYQGGTGLVDQQKLYNSAKGFITDAQLGDASEFFIEPPKGPDGQPVPQQPKPDPEMQKLQMQMQAKQAELQAKIQTKQQEMQLKLAEMQQKAASEAQIASFEAQQEAEIARWKAGQEAELARMKAVMEAQTRQNLPDNRPGGSLAS
ncbi:MAG: hypothetical protein RIR00_2632, partial [Pseudomonadota bacterium]